MDTSASEWDPRDFVVERYPKRSRKNKIDDLSLLDEPDLDNFNKAERLSKLPYSIKELLESDDYSQEDVVLELPVSDLSRDYIRQTGLLRPLLFNVPPEQLGMRMPDPQAFTVSDVLDLVGGDRRIEVVEVYEQKGSYMLLKEFIEYYKKSPSERTKLLNVLSLEFTSTKLAEKVSAPAFVSEIDWIDKKSAWARSNDFSTYPKVQRYCLMSVANCFTDFHIDFGGTSVWYHILKGEKIFWMIEPTEDNLVLYEDWILTGSENSCFFGELVSKCARVRLCQGHTLIIPSGWIHCVYTPVDSLVFGGNFLHSYSIPMQIRVSKSEDRIKIGSKYRFPHFKQMFWCYIAAIVRSATRRIYQKKLTEEAHIHLSQKVDSTTSNENDTSEAHESNLVCPPYNSSVDEKNGCLLPNGQTPQLPTDGEEICYDDALGNAVDGSLTFNPIQSVYDSQDQASFTPTQRYNLDYLNSLPPLVINGLHSLGDYAKKLLKSKQPEVVEGITRPHHLVKEFRALIGKINELGLPKETPVTLSVKLPPRDDKRKMKRHGIVDESVQKKALKKKNVLNQLTSSGTILVGGLPLPTHLNTPSSSTGFNPMGEIVKLGQKPMQSAWRKATNMAKPPPPTHIYQIKKRFEASISDEKSMDNSSIEFEMEKGIEAEESAMDTTFAKQSASDGINRDKKLGQKHRKPVPKLPNKLIEIHDDSPEFSHRSPLQRMKGQETKNLSNAFQPHNQSLPSFGQPNTNRNEVFGHPKNGNRWTCERGGEHTTGGFRPHNKSWNSFNGRGGGGQRERPQNGGRGGGFNQARNFSSNWDRNPSNRWNTEGNDGTIEGHSDWNSFGNQSSDDTGFFNSTINTSAAFSIPRESAAFDPYPTSTTSHKPMQQQQPQQKRQYEQGIYHQPPEPISTAVNELHHISQIMDAPSSVGLNEMSVDQIPLPSDAPRFLHTFSSEPDVDELENISRMMHE
uniref:JmjC domain-containing protein n=1 Tax=Globodera rostochiensis TaxID=31243 RepID=A0A914HSC7_GLORO